MNDDQTKIRRRTFVGGVGAAAGMSATQGTQPTRQLIRPPVLKPGDTVGLITPATYVTDPDSLALAEITIKHFGLRMKMGRNVRRRAGYLGGTVRERIEDLHDMFGDPEVKGVFAIRGGYGSMHLLDHIDYDLIRKNPKIFLGYSDITAMHLAINRYAGLVTFHGPVVLSSYTGYTQAHFRKALFESTPIGAVTNPPEGNPLRPAHMLRTVRGGKASGPLTGGNLTLIANTMGTPYEIDTRGKILFLEEVGEEPYRIDRMLTQLRLAEKLDQAAGIIFGECRSCEPREYQPSFQSTFSLGEIVDQFLSGLKIPVLSGLTVGHTSDQLTLPMGITATLDADKGELNIEQPASAG